ncbi:39320_t:CDS:2 [Gigaspora margarita]|uniref:39320_t:CDS:1 n=1 Tax=Gigaspora margarita TaxID=4874 RepID=A0ABN7VDS4_GIGMA|nr:39320_t:CDS:2 [Gigaspora margarita]
MAEFLAEKIDTILEEVGQNRFTAIVTDNTRCNEIIKYFKKSHQPNAYLQQAIHELNIPGGELRKFIDTRWTSAYECTLSISQLEHALIKAQLTMLADCFVQFISLVAATKKIQSSRINEFKNYCKQVFSKRWNNFNMNIYLLAYFLHQEYHSAGLYEKLLFFGKQILLNDLQVQVESATFLVEVDERIIEDFEVEEAKYNLKLLKILILKHSVFNFDPTELAANLVRE